MAVSIYFTESKDFKLVKEFIDVASDDYLIYVYTDTKNIKLPRDLVKDLPLFGNGIIWVDSADMDNSQLVNHVMLTIGQFLNAEDPITFQIASKTGRFDKAISLLKSQGIGVEKIGSDIADSKPGKKSGRPKGSGKSTGKKRGRPPKVKKEAEEKPAKKKRGRPPKDKTESAKASGAQTAPKKKRGRPAKKKEAPKKARKPRVDKPITEAMIAESLAKFPTKDGDVEQIQKKLFGMKKVQRPKFDQKLSEMIQTELAIGESEANSLIAKMKETGMMDNSGKGNRLKYQD